MFTILQGNPAAVYYTESNFSAPIRWSTCCPKSSASADMHFTIPSCPCNERSLCPPVLKSKRDCALVDSNRNRQRGGSQRGPVRASASRSAEPETQTPPAPPLAAELPEFRMHNSPIHRQARERQTLRAKVSDLNGQPFTAAFLAAALGNNTSAAAQAGRRQGCIAYQGGAGSNGEELAAELYPNLDPLPCGNYEDAFLALTSFAAEKALVPIENSLGGSIQEVFDLFLRYNVTIEREAFSTIRKCLAARPGTSKASVKRIFCDTLSLKQCDLYLKGLQGVTRETAANSEFSAQQTTIDTSGTAAAIVTERTAQLYGLEILETNIQDNKDGDITRYVLLTRDMIRLSQDAAGSYKTSVVFAFPEKAGLLFHCLSVFALRDINLTKIESRPFREDPTIIDPQLGRKFQYRFYVDFAGGLFQTSVQNALVHLREIAPFVKVLGCYPASDASVSSPAVETRSAEEVREQLAASTNPVSSANGSEGSNGAFAPDSLLISAAASARPIRQESIGEAGMRVAYQGNPGAYSESAVLNAFPDGHPVPCEHFEDAFQALSQFLVDRAVLPIENSLGGSIHAVYDLLIQYKLYIIGETTVAVNHCLLALPGVNKQDLKRVISHYQALAQVDGYTRNMGVIREAVDDTAGAAQIIAENGWRDTAAVASARAGELYGLTALDTSIQDNKNNITRFLVLSRDPRVQAPSSNQLCKTSVVFSLKEGPGELFKACSVFALRKLDMTKIESRPLRMVSPENGRKQQFRYLFYIDFAASLADEAGQNALRHLSELATFMRVLGCYPMNMPQH